MAGTWWRPGAWRARWTVTVSACALACGGPDVSGALAQVAAGDVPAVRAVLLSAYDEDGDGRVAGAELLAVPCATWQAAESGLGVRARGGSLWATWSLDALGLDAADAVALSDRLDACDVADLEAPETGAPSLDERLAALPVTGSVDAWLAAARAVVLVRDRDGSGLIDTPAEADAVGCAPLQRVAARARSLSGPPGAAAGLGDAAAAAWDACTSAAATDAPAATPSATDPSPVEAPPVPDPEPPQRVEPVPAAKPVVGDPPPTPKSAPSVISLADRMRTVPMPRTDGWNWGLRDLVVETADRDGDGVMSATEVGRASCEGLRTWDALVREHLGAPLEVHLGVKPGKVFLAKDAGCVPSALDNFRARLKACGVQVTMPAAAPAPDPAPSGGGAAALLKAVPSASADFNGMVRKTLLAVHDKDGSGSLDTASEVAGIPCADFKAIDDKVRARQGGTGMDVIYGFREGFIWVGGALGFAPSLRATTSSRLKACGVAR
jgi:hypothetical protein